MKIGLITKISFIFGFFVAIVVEGIIFWGTFESIPTGLSFLMIGIIMMATVLLIVLLDNPR